MADFRSICDDIRGEFDDAWTALSNGVDVAWPNEPRKATQPDTQDSWARLSIVSADGITNGIGERTSDMRGRVIFQIFTPLGEGTASSHELVDDAVNIFQNIAIGDANFLTSRVVVVGVDADGAWWQENVETPFRFENTPN